MLKPIENANLIISVYSVFFMALYYISVLVLICYNEQEYFASQVICASYTIVNKNNCKVLKNNNNDLK